MPRWPFYFKKRPQNTQLDAAIGFHIDQLTQEKIASGIPPVEARRQAVLQFGSREQTKEELRDVHRVPNFAVQRDVASVKDSLASTLLRCQDPPESVAHRLQV